MERKRDGSFSIDGPFRL